MKTEKTTATATAEKAPAPETAVELTEAAEEKAKKEPVCDVIKKRRWGDRSDGRRVRTMSVMGQLIPYIMRERSDAQNHIEENFNVDRVLEYINEKRRAGYQGFGFMHFMMATYIRAVAEYPGINRFVNGQKVYTREGWVEISLVIKQEMVLEAPDSVVKLTLRPDATALDVYDALYTKINAYRDVKDSSFDKLMNVINFIPGLLKRWTVALLFFLDYWGLLPRFLTRLSPFHSSLYVTSMGSLGIPSIYHHLYNFGNVPIFCSFGTKHRETELRRDGSVAEHSYIDVKFVLDERICDGFYFAAALKYMRRFFRDPWALDVPPAEVKKDID